ncbi:hypothetical protein WN944_017323 [Citrus x changshan-huyou]|uniref:Protein ARV n=1 Tax=Citrus x changshan-huyou TaxID=2935761 RepID=A0AAP0QL40_9ROSI
MEYRCVKCGFRIKTLFVQYSPGNIRLMKCENCRAVADEYIECEIMILLIDLILHKPQAYRHLLYNVLNSETVNLQMLKDVVLGNVMFLGVFLHASRILLNTSAGASRFKDFLLAVLISSYFKIFLLAMMVWNFPSSVIYIIDLFVLSSNTVALKVITESAMNRILGVCLVAHAVKFFVVQGLELRYLRY